MKKTLIRLITLCLLLASLVSVLASCHGKVILPSFSMPEEFDENKKYEISFWAKNDTNLSQVAVYKQAISEFEALYPNVYVNLVLYTDYGRIYSDVITNIQTGTTPNVCIPYPDHIATYMTGENVVVPLDELMANEKYGLGGSALLFDSPSEDEIIDEFLAEGKIGGTQYALPFMRSTEALYINETYVNALGYDVPDVVTWEFIFEVSKKAAAKGEDGKYLLNGQDVLIPLLYKSTDNMMIQMLRQLEADYSTEEGEILLFNDETKEILNEVADSAKAGAFSTFKISGYPANFLNAGQCVFAIDSTAGATWMGSNAPNIDIAEEKVVDFDIAVRTVPQYDEEKPQMISQGPSVCIFNKKDSGEVLASWLFTQYLLTDGIQMGYSMTEGYLPVTKTAISSPEYADYLSRGGEDNELYYDVKIQATNLLLENTENTFTTPVFNGSASLRNAAGQLIEEVVKGVRRGKTVDDKFISDLYAKMISLYHLDSIDTSGGGEREKAELGPLPAGAVALIASFSAIWLVILAYLVIKLIKKEKVKRKY